MIDKTGTVRVAIICDQPIINAGIRRLVESIGSIIIVTDFESLTEAVVASHSIQADLAITVFSSRFFFPQVFQTCLLPLPTVVLIHDPTKSELLTIQAAGIRGLLLQGASRQDYLDAIETVASGKTYLSPQLSSFLEETTLPPGWASLTNRERLYFCLVTSGLSSTEITASMNVSTVAIRSYRRKLYKKMETSDTSGLARIATKYGFVP